MGKKTEIKPFSMLHTSRTLQQYFLNIWTNHNYHSWPVMQTLAIKDIIDN